MTMMRFLTLISILLISPLSFSESQEKNYQARLQDVMKARKLMDRKRERDEIKDLAQQLAQEILIIDTHLDTPIQLYMQQSKNGSYEDITKASSLHFDFDRAVSGGLNVPFFVIFTCDLFFHQQYWKHTNPYYLSWSRDSKRVEITYGVLLRRIRF